MLTYERAPPQPERFVTSGGTTLMTADDIVAGKAGFQKADLMDYGSLLRHGLLLRAGLHRLDADAPRHAHRGQPRPGAVYGKPFDALPPDQQAAVRDAMREQLQRLDLTQQEVTVPEALAGAITTLRAEMAASLGNVDLATGWTPAYSLDQDAGAADRRLPDLFRPDHGGAPAGRELVVDRELAL